MVLQVDQWLRVAGILLRRRMPQRFGAADIARPEILRRLNLELPVDAVYFRVEGEASPPMTSSRERATMATHAPLPLNGEPGAPFQRHSWRAVK